MAPFSARFLAAARFAARFLAARFGGRENYRGHIPARFLASPQALALEHFM